MSTREILWAPDRHRAETSQMARFIDWLAENRGLTFDDYQALWQWSVDDLDGFWSAIWAFFDIQHSAPPTKILADRRMPGAIWFPGAKVNLAAQILGWDAKKPGEPAIITRSETFGRREISWAQLSEQVASVASGFRAMGVGPGDRVVAVLPNTETALVAFLASASVGAIWSLCAPDMGHVAILDRFRQIEPKILIAQDGFVHGGKVNDRRDILRVIVEGLPTVEHWLTVPVPGLAAGPTSKNATPWADLTTDTNARHDFEQVDFDHPLWVVYSSGTTGNPKPIVQGHGGIMLEAAKQSLHQDLSEKDRFAWLTSSGWIMWNAQLVALGQGATLALFDGAPNYPDLGEVWRFVADEHLSYFGAGAAFFTACAKDGQQPGADTDLSDLRSIGATGSPLTADAYDWIYSAVKPDVWLAPISGGTDLCGAFVGGNPMLPVRAGEMQCRFLGNAVRAFDEDGRELIGDVGELVCTEPLPSMPLYFWGDDNGQRLHDSYFDTYAGIWRHGDWIEITRDGGAVIFGRSDATINRRGLRLGSSEIYQAVEGLAEVQDSLVIDLEYLGRESFMALFVVPVPGQVVGQELRDKINAAIRRDVSARFLPNEIVEIADVPRTLSGKKLEVPVKKLLLGGDPEMVVNRDSMVNPDSFDAFIAYAANRA